MDEDENDVSDVSVKYLVACVRATKPFDRPEDPYTLHELTYTFDIPTDHEWPVRLKGLSLYARFYGGVGSRAFTIGVYWVDAPADVESEVGFFDWTISFPDGQVVFDRVWNVSTTRYPGPGRYRFVLTDDRTGAELATEYIEMRSRDETETNE